MLYTENNCLPVNKYSTRTVMPDCESVRMFSFDHDTNVEVILINGEPYFVAADVCRALGLKPDRPHCKIT
jgi:prophage antirepressor-like protein